MRKRMTLGHAVVTCWPAMAGALIPAAYKVGAGASVAAEVCVAGIVWMMAATMMITADHIFAKRDSAAQEGEQNG